MINSELEKAIEGAWGVREEINPSTKGEKREAIESTLSALDSGNLRVAEKTDKNDWVWRYTMVDHKNPVGGTKSTTSLEGGPVKIGKMQVFGLFQAVL